MNSDLINRGDALVIAQYSEDKVEGIKNLPAVDAVEVVHAKWIRPTKIDGRTFHLPHCSNCGEVPCDKGNYCPNCGARMDGE